MPRVIFSLQLDTQPGGRAFLIAPLDSAGQSPRFVPCPPKTRVVDLRAGDEFDHGCVRYTVHRVKVHRQAKDWKGPAPDDGYLVRGGRAFGE